MTVVVKQHTGNSYYVSMSIERRCGNEVYVVQVCPCYKDGTCGHPEREMTYSLYAKRNADATYRRYVKNYCD